MAYQCFSGREACGFWTSGFQKLVCHPRGVVSHAILERGAYGIWADSTLILMSPDPSEKYAAFRSRIKMFPLVRLLQLWLISSHIMLLFYFIQLLLDTRHCSEHFTNLNSFNSHNQRGNTIPHIIVEEPRGGGWWGNLPHGFKYI